MIPSLPPLRGIIMNRFNQKLADAVRKLEAYHQTLGSLFFQPKESLTTPFFDALSEASAQVLQHQPRDNYHEMELRSFILINKGWFLPALEKYLLQCSPSEVLEKCDPRTALGALIDHHRISTNSTDSTKTRVLFVQRRIAADLSGFARPLARTSENQALYDITIRPVLIAFLEEQGFPELTGKVKSKLEKRIQEACALFVGENATQLSSQILAPFFASYHLAHTQLVWNAANFDKESPGTLIKKYQACIKNHLGVFLGEQAANAMVEYHKKQLSQGEDQRVFTASLSSTPQEPEPPMDDFLRYLAQEAAEAEAAEAEAAVKKAREQAQIALPMPDDSKEVKKLIIAVAPQRLFQPAPQPLSNKALRYLAIFNRLANEKYFMHGVFGSIDTSKSPRDQRNQWVSVLTPTELQVIQKAAAEEFHLGAAVTIPQSQIPIVTVDVSSTDDAEPAQRRYAPA